MNMNGMPTLRLRAPRSPWFAPAGHRPAPVRRPHEPKLALTIERQTGAGALTVAEKLAEYLEAQAPTENRPWTVYDQNLVQKVLEDHHLPQKLVRFMPEDRVSLIEDTMQELLGLHPPTWTLVYHATETMLKLAEVGNVILVGRGSTTITAKLPHVFHIRLVGSLARRIERVSHYYGLGPKAARAYLEKTEQGRRDYVRRHFRANLDDPLLYHLVVNTDHLSAQEAARVVGEAAIHHARTLQSTGASPRPGLSHAASSPAEAKAAGANRAAA